MNTEGVGNGDQPDQGVRNIAHGTQFLSEAKCHGAGLQTFGCQHNSRDSKSWKFSFGAESKLKQIYFSRSECLTVMRWRRGVLGEWNSWLQLKRKTPWRGSASQKEPFASKSAAF